ncbi:hypothetical protein SDC9_54509 [bioreactor metagenome]|uniref:Copper amine oxidase-like N-terminal domain-containing protein n=1 Tax=bioreactor metagenome TaxID=1076179 RepID=A0A644WWX0_9ZZZZ
MTLAFSVSAVPVSAKNGNEKSVAASAQKEEKASKTSETTSDDSADLSKGSEKSSQKTEKEETKVQELKKVFKDELNDQKKELQQQKSDLNQQLETLEAQYQLMLASGDTVGAESALTSMNTLKAQIQGLQSQIKETINERYMVVKTMYTDEELVQFSSAADLIAQMYADAEVLSEGCVTVNNNLVKFDTPAYIKNGVTLVPLRAIAEELGGEVSWDEETQTVTITKGDTVVQITSNSTTAVVNGETVEISLPATETCGRTYVPLRFLSEALGLNTEWDSENEIIDITNDSDTAADSVGGTTEDENTGDSSESLESVTPVVAES